MHKFLRSLFGSWFDTTPAHDETAQAARDSSYVPPQNSERQPSRTHVGPARLESIAQTQAPAVPNGDKGSVVQSLLNVGTKFVGDLEVCGGIKIDGVVSGSARISEGVLVLTGAIEGDVFAETAFIDGRIEGSLCAARVLMGANGHIRGTVRYAEMHWQQGARIDGDVRQVSAAEMVGAISQSPPNASSALEPSTDAQSRTHQKAPLRELVRSIVKPVQQPVDASAA